MAVPILRSPFTRQPEGYLQVDFNNPLTRGLIAAVPLTGVIYDAITNAAVTFESAPVFSTSPSGRGMFFDGTDDGLLFMLPKTLSLPVTLLCVFAIDPTSNVFDNTAQRDYPVSLRDESSAYEVFNVGIANTAGSVALVTAGMLDDTSGSGVGVDGTTNLWTGYAGKDLTIAGVFTNTTTQAVYLNGILETSSAALTARDPNVTRLYIGHTSSSSASVDFAKGVVKSVFVWERALSADEIKRVSDNPWALFVPPKGRIWVPADGSAGIVAEAADSVVFGDSAEAVTNRDAQATDGVVFGDSAVAVTERVAAAADSVVFGDSAVAAVTLPAVAVDSVVFGDSAVAEVDSGITASAQDSVVFGDSAVAVTNRTAAAEDGVVFGDSALADVQKVAVAADSVVFGDSAVAAIGSQTFTAVAQDGVVFGDFAVATKTTPGAATYGPGWPMADRWKKRKPKERPEQPTRADIREQLQELLDVKAPGTSVPVLEETVPVSVVGGRVVEALKFVAKAVRLKDKEVLASNLRHAQEEIDKAIRRAEIIRRNNEFMMME